MSFVFCVSVSFRNCGGKDNRFEILLLNKPPPFLFFLFSCSLFLCFCSVVPRFHLWVKGVIWCRNLQTNCYFLCDQLRQLSTFLGDKNRIIFFTQINIGWLEYSFLFILICFSITCAHFIFCFRSYFWRIFLVPAIHVESHFLQLFDI